MENKTGKITRYNAYVITGEHTAIGNYWISADSPEVLNRMISQRAALTQRGVMFHVVVFKGDYAVSATKLKQATAIAFKNKFTNMITFVKDDWQGRYLLSMAKANVGKNNLVFIK